MIRDQFDGMIMLIFQHAEEQVPGGAIQLIEQGQIFKDIQPKCIIGQHVGPNMNVGTVKLRNGYIYASSDEIILRIHGKGGHAARPMDYINPLIMSSHILIKLNDDYINPKTKIIRRDQRLVLTFGSISSINGSYNTVADTVEIKGTLRAYDDELRYQVWEDLKRITNKICTKYGGRCDIEINKGYPATFNHIKLTEYIRRNMKELLCSPLHNPYGKNYDSSKESTYSSPIFATYNNNNYQSNVGIAESVMGSEDFSYYSKLFPGCYWRLGIGMNSNSLLHTKDMIASDYSIYTGTKVLVYNAIRLLTSVSIDL